MITSEIEKDIHKLIEDDLLINALEKLASEDFSALQALKEAIKDTL